jgi:hypothetical protein
MGENGMTTCQLAGKVRACQKRQSGDLRAIRHAMFMLHSVSFMRNKLYSLFQYIKSIKVATFMHSIRSRQQAEAGFSLIVFVCRGVPVCQPAVRYWS